MIGRSHGDGSTVPSLSHADAEGLISARLDVPLDPRQEQMLAVHLRSCQTCKQFADQMDAMRTGFRAIPHLPASPTVTRQVRERIAQPQSLWARLGGVFGGQLGGAPMAASAALIALVIVSYALFERNSDDRNNGPVITAGTQITSTATVPRDVFVQPTSANALASDATVAPGRVITPSEVATSLPNIRAATEQATQVGLLASAPTNTVPAEATSTEIPTTEPTESDTPVNTATPSIEPTREPTGRATDVSTIEPTETERPTRTATSTAESTSTDEPTEEPTATDIPTREPSSTKTPTKEPTTTEKPTDEPTSTERPAREPTGTEEPTATLEPTATEEPTEAGPPTIESIGDPIDESETVPIEEDTVESVPTEQELIEETPAIEPIDADPTIDSGAPDDIGGPSDDEPTVDSSAANDDLAPLDNSGRIAGLPSSGGAPVGPLRINSPLSLMVVSGDAGGSTLQVVSTGDGTLFADLGAGANPIWSPLGIVLLYQDFSRDTPSASIYDSETDQIIRISNPDEFGAQQDIPAGWAGTAAFFLRVNGDGSISLLGYDVNSLKTFTVWDGGEAGFSGIRPIPTGDGFLIATQSSWLRIGVDGSESDLGPNEIGITGEGFLSPYATLVAYPAGGQLIVADVNNPGAPIGAVPYVDGPGSGFTWQPDGEFIAVSDGFSIQVYDYLGNFIGAATSDAGVTIAAPQWLGDGIYYVETSPSPSLRRLINDKIPGFGG